MARILAIDYGKKRCGIAVTDPLQIIATALEMIHSKDLINFLENYFGEEEVEEVVLGMPKNLDGNDTDGTIFVNNFAKQFAKKFPNMPLNFHDERFTSKMALNSMIQAGSKKKDRIEKKGNIDKVSATILLQSFLESKEAK